MQHKTVYVGLSGGVDSSVTAYLLREQGYDVVGVHMKNWTQDIGGFACPWKEDYQDAKRLAAFLGIEFKLFDFEKDYKQCVVDYMIDEFKSGRTPNPDVMCNQEIKFKLFLEASLQHGADMIATGHYARVHDGQMYQARDQNKDQTYFLYRITREALLKTLFPLGELTKTQVRQIACDAGLPNASRKESMGICFVGKVGIQDFLRQYVTAEPGKILDENGKYLGEHSGAIFYTIGQRSGLGIGGGMPYYVTGKDMDANVVYVTKDLSSSLLWSDSIQMTSLHWIGESPIAGQAIRVRTRHRAPLINGIIEKVDTNTTTIKLEEPVRALTPGQSTVVYRSESNECLGGGIIN